MKIMQWVCLVVLLSGAVVLRAQTVDSLNPLPQVAPTTVALQADGKIIIAGNFNEIATTPCVRVARINADGSLDAAFCANVNVDSEVKAVAIQTDGKIVIAGDFTSVDSQTRHSLARLNSDGTLDTAFADAGFNDTVWGIAIEPADNKILVVGDFNQAMSGASAVGQQGAARVNTNGTLDTSFANPQINMGVALAEARSIALQSDGHVIVGGAFSNVGGASHFYFVRFSSAGVIDASFPTTANPPIPQAILVAPDGSIFVADGGTDAIKKYTTAGAAVTAFNNVQGDGAIYTFALQPNGKIVIGGDFATVGGQPRHALARLDSDGSLDTTFVDQHFSFSSTNPAGYIFALAEQDDGGIVAVGSFTFVDTLSRQTMARVQTNDAIESTLTGVASGSSVIVTWNRTGDGTEMAVPPVLMHSSDGVNFTAVASMTRVTNGWQATANYNVNGTPFYLRADGFASSGAGNGSLSRVDSPTYVSDRIFADGFE